eukprot:gene7851-33567_t
MAQKVTDCGDPPCPRGAVNGASGFLFYCLTFLIDYT